MQANKVCLQKLKGKLLEKHFFITELFFIQLIFSSYQNMQKKTENPIAKAK
jgi:hypothetical protein